jgi:hypothetical protein
LRRPMMLLSLIAALSATPLRLAESAHDFACSLAKLDVGDVIEIPDGGVGDDSDATIKTAKCEAPGPSFCLTAIAPELLDTILPTRWQVFKRLEDPPRTRATLSRRLAVLQTFLI